MPRVKGNGTAIFVRLNRLSFIALLIVLASSGCDRCERLEGPREIYQRPLGSVTSLEMNTPADLRIRKDTGAFSTVEVVAQPELERVLTTKVKNGHCEIDMDACFRDQLGLMMDMTVKQLNSVHSTAAGDIRSIELIEQDTIDITNSGLGDIDLLLNARKITGVVESSGNILLSGEAQSVHFISVSSGELEAFNLFADTVIIYTLGTGLIDVYASEYLEVNFLKSSTVQYRGTPTEIVVSGEGNLKDANL